MRAVSVSVSPEDCLKTEREYKINYCRLYVYIDPLLKAQMETIDESMANNRLDDVNKRFTGAE